MVELESCAGAAFGCETVCEKAVFGAAQEAVGGGGDVTASEWERECGAYDIQMRRLLERLDEASGGSALSCAVGALDAFLRFKLNPDGATLLCSESLLRFNAALFCDPGVRQAILVRLLGDSLNAGERLQARLLSDFAQLEEEGSLRVSKGRKRRNGEGFERVVAHEMANDLLALHRERLCQADACFELGEPAAALACLDDYACFLECVVFPRVQLMAKISGSDAWMVLPEKSVRSRVIAGRRWLEGHAAEDASSRTL